MDIPIGQQNIRFPGYGMFWVANSITSTIMGFANRHMQEKSAEANLLFEDEMKRARQITDDERLQKEIAFKREMMVLGRQHSEIESAKAFTNRMKGVEFKHFITNCWPLEPQMPYNLLKEIEVAQQHGVDKRLNVILLHSPFYPVSRWGDSDPKDVAIYKELEDAIDRNDIPAIGLNDLRFRKDACSKTDVTGGNANIMNIHFLMSQLPTLVISPRYYEGKLSFSGAVWESQAARPLVRPLLSYDFEPQITVGEEEANKIYRENAIELFHTTISIIIGTVRDSYMLLTQGKEPTLGKWLNDSKHTKMKALIQRNHVLSDFIKRENDNVLAALSIENSPKLLEAYTQEDIDRMRQQVKSIKI